MRGIDLRRAPVGKASVEVGSEPELVERIREEIAAAGPMTFARFMERALYEPALGYYRRATPGPGMSGDFLTAPETHPVFGRLLARQIAEVWQLLGKPPTLTIREHGAGNGVLAEALLGGLVADAGELLDVVRYEPVEVEEARLSAMEGRLRAAGVDHLAAVPSAEPITGVVLANEVLDALPTHRVRASTAADGGLEELFVDWQDGRFVEVAGPPSTPALAGRLADEGVRLRGGQVAEVCLAADPWIDAAATSLERGVLLLIDYGHPAAELYGPRRMAGTIAAYVGHRVHDDPLINVGRQDLTAHVDLTAVERAAARAGLAHLGTTTQSKLLVNLGLEDLLREVQADPATTAERYLALRSGVVRLLDPRATGSFAVLAFGRGLPPGVGLRGLS